MRKRLEQQKKQGGYQLTLFDKLTNLPCHDTDSGTIRVQGKGVEHLSHLERQRTLTDVSRFKRLIEIALVRSTYAGWCGGTAAQAASYPIDK